MKFNYKTVTRKILADLYTPVGVYMDKVNSASPRGLER